MIDLLAEPLSTDIAWQIVNAVLPSEATTMWGRVLQVFTSVLFFLGGLFVAYQTVVGIVATAHTGQVLGNRWHQIWVPLRIVVGLGLLAPLPSTGFSSAHYILRDVVARAGINLANAMSSTGIKTVVEDGTTIVPVSVDGSTVAMTILQHEICAAVYNRAGDLWGGPRDLRSQKASLPRQLSKRGSASSSPGTMEGRVAGSRTSFPKTEKRSRPHGVRASRPSF